LVGYLFTEISLIGEIKSSVVQIKTQLLFYFLSTLRVILKKKNITITNNFNASKTNQLLNKHELVITKSTIHVLRKY